MLCVEYQSSVLTTLPVHPLMHVFPLPDRDGNTSALTHWRMRSSVDSTSIKKFWFTQVLIVTCAWLRDSSYCTHMNLKCRKSNTGIKWKESSEKEISAMGTLYWILSWCAGEEGGRQCSAPGSDALQRCPPAGAVASWPPGGPPLLAEAKRSQWGCSDFRTGCRGWYCLVWI